MQDNQQLINKFGINNIYFAKEGEEIDINKISQSVIVVPPSRTYEKDDDEDNRNAKKEREKKEPRRPIVKEDRILEELKKRKILDEDLEIDPLDDLFLLRDSEAQEWASEINEESKKKNL